MSEGKGARRCEGLITVEAATTAGEPVGFSGVMLVETTGRLTTHVFVVLSMMYWQGQSSGLYLRGSSGHRSGQGRRRKKRKKKPEEYLSAPRFHPPLPINIGQ